MAHSIDKIVELVIIGALLCIVPLVTLVMACIKTAEESYFKQHAIIAMGKNVSYNLNPDSTVKQILITLADGSEELVQSQVFVPIRTIPLEALVRVAYTEKIVFGMKVYDLKIIDEHYVKKRKMSWAGVMWLITAISTVAAIVIIFCVGKYIL